MARSNTDSPNIENSQHQDREEREPSKNSSSSRRRKASRSVSSDSHSSNSRGRRRSRSSYLKSHVAVREGERILVPHLPKDQEPLGAENVKILAVS